MSLEVSGGLVRVEALAGGGAAWAQPLAAAGPDVKILFARGRRTVTTWLRAAGVSDDYQDYYYYVRRKTMARIPEWRGWTFASKLVLAARLVEWIAPIVKQAGKTLWIVVDGGYVKTPFLKRALRAGVTVVGRLRKDAALRDLPPKLRRGQRRSRGRPAKYGKNTIGELPGFVG